MDIVIIQNPKGSNVYRFNMINERMTPTVSNVYRIGCAEHTTPTGSNVYRIIYDAIHSTPMGSYQSDEYGFSINMLSLRDSAQQLTNK